MAKQVTDRGNGVEPESVKRFKPRLAFSIDSILGRSDETALNQTSVGREATLAFAPVDSRSVSRLPWLSYSRYSPPKLPSECCQPILILFLSLSNENSTVSLFLAVRLKHYTTFFSFRCSRFTLRFMI